MKTLGLLTNQLQKIVDIFDRRKKPIDKSTIFFTYICTRIILRWPAALCVVVQAVSWLLTNTIMHFSVTENRDAIVLSPR